jgi:hypothetical protein
MAAEAHRTIAAAEFTPELREQEERLRAERAEQQNGS